MNTRQGAVVVYLSNTRFFPDFFGAILLLPGGGSDLGLFDRPPAPYSLTTGVANDRTLLVSISQTSKAG